jgi:hypothetical protein
MQFWGEFKMPLDINGQGSISGITSLNTSASVNLSETELGYLDGVTSGLQTQINTAGGLVKIVDQSFTSASAVSVNGCFSNTSNNHLIIFRGVSSSDNESLRFRMKLSGTDSTASSYSFGGLQTFLSSGPTRDTATAQTSGKFTNTSNLDFTLVATFTNAALPSPTQIVAQSYGASTTTLLVTNYGSYHDVSTAYDGITIFPGAGNITGTFRVYGYRN